MIFKRKTNNEIEHILTYISEENSKIYERMDEIKKDINTQHDEDFINIIEMLEYVSSKIDKLNNPEKTNSNNDVVEEHGLPKHMDAFSIYYKYLKKCSSKTEAVKRTADYLGMSERTIFRWYKNYHWDTLLKIKIEGDFHNVLNNEEDEVLKCIDYDNNVSNSEIKRITNENIELCNEITQIKNNNAILNKKLNESNNNIKRLVEVKNKLHDKLGEFKRLKLELDKKKNVVESDLRKEICELTEELEEKNGELSRLKKKEKEYSNLTNSVKFGVNDRVKYRGELIVDEIGCITTKKRYSKKGNMLRINIYDMINVYDINSPDLTENELVDYISEVYCNINPNTVNKIKKCLYNIRTTQLQKKIIEPFINRENNFSLNDNNIICINGNSLNLSPDEVRIFFDTVYNKNNPFDAINNYKKQFKTIKSRTVIDCLWYNRENPSLRNLLNNSTEILIVNNPQKRKERGFYNGGVL